MGERGEVHDWTLLQEALQRLDAFASAEDATAEVKLECAHGWMSATANYGKVAEAAGERGEVVDWMPLQAALRRLDALASAEEATAEVKLRCAKGWTNATAYYGYVARAAAIQRKTIDIPDLSSSSIFIERSLSWYQTHETAEQLFILCCNVYAIENQLIESVTSANVRFLVARLALQPELHYAPVQHDIFRRFPGLTFREQEARGFAVAGHPPKAKQPPASLDAASS